MSDVYCLLFWMAQLETPPGPSQPPAGGAAQQGSEGGIWPYLLIMLPIILLFTILGSKPQQKEQQRQRKFLDELKKNDRVITAGGILGTVVNISGDSEFVTLKIDENNNTKLQVLKQSIVRVVKEDDSTKDGAA